MPRKETTVFDQAALNVLLDGLQHLSGKISAIIESMTEEQVRTLDIRYAPSMREGMQKLKLFAHAAEEAWFEKILDQSIENAENAEGKDKTDQGSPGGSHKPKKRP